MIEAMACGTPVIAFNCGSVPEVIDHGVTGFIVDSLGDAVATAAQVDRLDRAHIRRVFEQRFTSEHMASAYVTAYTRLLSTTRLSNTA
jgi:glycosyltransferase involved in cell wall biosynthesis